MQNMLEINNLNFSYHTKQGETNALEKLCMSVKPGEFISIVGPSGCGKTTILSLIAGLMQPSAGEIFVDGNEVQKINTDVGYMFQKDNLFEWLNVLQNINLGLSIQKKNSDSSDKFLNSLLEKYGLSYFKKYFPNQLSGGMRQRVALIRTLATSPKLLLLDEPFSALDYQTRLEVQADVLRIIKSENKTAILVTHDIAEAITMSDKIIILTERPGSVKSILNIDMDPSLSPIDRRRQPKFNTYFNRIWGELKNEEND